MMDQPGLKQLLDELASADEGVRLERLRQHCQRIGFSSAGAVLRGLLSSPVKWQRETAADVANDLEFDPFSEEDEIVQEEEAPVLTLGFEDDPSSEEGVVSGLYTDPSDQPPVTFLGPCVEPHESGSEFVGGLTQAPVQRASLGIWLAFGSAAIVGIMLLRWLTSDL